MALDLFASYNASATVYVILRKQSDGTVWNGSAFAAWADGSIASYDIPLSSQGGDLYAANVPSGVSAGTYIALPYLQAGGSPAITDTLLGNAVRTFYWNGTAASGTPDSDYLTSLSRVKEYLNISVSTYDDKLTNLLSAASRAIERYCDAKFVSAARTEYHNGRGTNFLLLDAYPVTASPKISLAVVCLEVQNTDADTYESLVKVDSGVMTLTRNGSDSTLTLSSYATLDLLAAAIVALGSGWTASVQYTYGSHPASRIRDTQGVLESNECSARLEMFVPVVGRSRCNTETGSVEVDRRLPCGLRNVQAVYTGGYTTIPDDLQTAACDLTAALYRQSTRDVTLQSEKLGDYSYTNFSGMLTAGQMQSLAPTAMELLKPFRRVHAL